MRAEATGPVKNLRVVEWGAGSYSSSPRLQRRGPGNVWMSGDGPIKVKPRANEGSRLSLIRQAGTWHRRGPAVTDGPTLGRGKEVRPRPSWIWPLQSSIINIFELFWVFGLPTPVQNKPKFYHKSISSQNDEGGLILIYNVGNWDFLVVAFATNSRAKDGSVWKWCNACYLTWW